MIRLVMANLLLTALCLAVFDMVAFTLLPTRHVLAFPDYRRAPRPTEPGIEGWPRDYYLGNL